MTKEIQIHFTDSAEEEVSQLTREMRLAQILEALKNNQALTPELKGDLEGLVVVLADILDTSLPALQGSPEDTLRAVSRDINLSRLLRERGLFRLFRLVREKQSNGTPAYMGMVNPTTGSPFARQEDFLAWFCLEAHVARSLVFMRLNSIAKCLSLGLSLEDAFQIIVTKPSAIRTTLNMVAGWNGDQLVDIDPEVAKRLAVKLLPERAAEQVRQLADDVKATGDAESRGALLEMIKPALVGLLREVSAHDHIHDAMDWVQHDILKKPEISYYWDAKADCLVVVLLRKSIDVQGTEFVAERLEIPLMADLPELPREVKMDLIRRLPIKNRTELDLW